MKFLPTPTGRDWKDTGGLGEMCRNDLTLPNVMRSLSEVSSPEPGSSTSDCTSPDGGTHGCANPTSGDGSCCEPGSGCPCIPTFESSAPIKLLPTPTSHERTHTPRPVDHGAQLANELWMLRESTSSPAGSHVAGPPAPVTAPGSIIQRLLSGSTCGASFARFDPGTYLSRTSDLRSPWQRMQTGLWDPCGEPFWPTWPRAACLSAGIITPLRPLAPRTSVTGSSPSLLPTPRASLNELRTTKRRPSEEAGTHGRYLVTPTGHMVKDTGAPSEFLRRSPEITATVLNLLPTPRSNDGSRPSMRRSSPDFSPTLGERVESLWTGASTSPPSAAGKPSTGLRLNPSFVEWMMGAPTCSECGRGWTNPDCQHAATAFTSTSDGSSGRM